MEKLENLLSLVEHGCYARDLHKALYIDQHFKDWIKVCLRLYPPHKDMTLVKGYKENKGRPCKTYQICSDLARSWAMVSKGEVAKAYRMYLINIEKACEVVHEIKETGNRATISRNKRKLKFNL